MLILRFIILVIVSETLTTSTYIPEDVEILDGYDLDQSPEYYPSDTYSEADSLINTGLTKAIRNKRSTTIDETDNGSLGVNKFINTPLLEDTQTEVNENADLEEMHPPNKSNESIFDRIRRSGINSQLTGELLPMPAKQTMMDANFYKKGTWNIHSFDSTDYNTRKYDDDLLVESTNNEGIKGRTPRVNFITQQNKNLNIDKDRGILPKLASTKSRYQQIDNPPNDLYPSRSYEPYLRRYDRYDDQYNRYDPYYEDYYLYRRRYDPYDSYSPRSPTYPDSYYHYPDRRYDVPEPRDYRQLYTNDIYDRVPPSPYQPPSSYQPPPSQTTTRNLNTNTNNGQRRIIYYAHLPEIVRNPTPNIDLTYQRYDPNRYEDQSYIGPVSGAYRHHENNQQNSHYSNQYGNEFVNREKKDHRNVQNYGGLPVNKNKSDRD